MTRSADQRDEAFRTFTAEGPTAPGRLSGILSAGPITLFRRTRDISLHAG